MGYVAESTHRLASPVKVRPSPIRDGQRARLCVFSAKVAPRGLKDGVSALCLPRAQATAVAVSGVKCPASRFEDPTFAHLREDQGTLGAQLLCIARPIVVPVAGAQGARGQTFPQPDNSGVGVVCAVQFCRAPKHTAPPPPKKNAVAVPPKGILGYGTCAQAAVGTKAQKENGLVSGLQDHGDLSKKNGHSVPPPPCPANDKGLKKYGPNRSVRWTRRSVPNQFGP